MPKSDCLDKEKVAYWVVLWSRGEVALLDNCGSNGKGLGRIT